MEIEFDPAKDAINREKHGVSLVFGEQVFADPKRVVLSSIRPIDGEDRFKVIGLVEDRLWTAIFVWRGAAVRFVSVRRSNNGEQGNYHSSSG